MSAARALVTIAADARPATATITFLKNFFMCIPLIETFKAVMAPNAFPSHLELDARAQFIEALSDLVGRNQRIRAGRRQLLDRDDVVVEHDADVLVQVPVDAERDDPLVATGDTGLRARRSGEGVAPVQVRVAIAHGEFPCSPGIA